MTKDNRLKLCLTHDQFTGLTALSADPDVSLQARIRKILTARTADEPLPIFVQMAEEILTQSLSMNRLLSLYGVEADLIDAARKTRKLADKLGISDAVG